MIYFNIAQARKQLMDNGFVYTLRAKHRYCGHTVAMWHSRPLCFVRILPVTAKVPDGLEQYLLFSGFDSVENWIKAASMNAKSLFLVART